MDPSRIEKRLADLCVRFSVMFLIVFGIFTIFLSGCSSQKIAEVGDYNTSEDSGAKESRAPGYDPTADQSCYRASDTVCQIERAIVQLTNQRIGNEGRPAQTYHARMAFAARTWAQEQVEIKRSNGSRIGHEGFPEQRKEIYTGEFETLDVKILAENIALIGNPPDSPQALAEGFVENWWNSDIHQKNMLLGHGLQGAGVWQSPDGNWYGVQLFGE